MVFSYDHKLVKINLRHIRGTVRWYAEMRAETSSIGLRGVVCPCLNFAMMVVTSFLFATSSPPTEIKMASRNSVFHFGMRPDGVPG